MYEVVLLDKHTNEQIGEIGTYETYEQAHYEATDFNRKSDRHRGKATVQGVLGMNTSPRPRVRPNPLRNPPPKRGLRINPAEYSSIPSNPSMRLKSSPNRRPIPQTNWEEDENVSLLRTRQRANPIERNVPQHNLHNPITPPIPKPFVCIYDSRKNRAFVLANKHLNSFLMANPYQEIIGEGTIMEMVKLRDQKNKGEI